MSQVPLMTPASPSQTIAQAQNRVLRNTYALLGLSLTVPTDLSAYELRQWGAANDPNETERLLLRASIVNRAAYALARLGDEERHALE